MRIARKEQEYTSMNASEIFYCPNKVRQHTERQKQGVVVKTPAAVASGAPCRHASPPPPHGASGGAQ